VFAICAVVLVCLGLVVLCFGLLTFALLAPREDNWRRWGEVFVDCCRPLAYGLILVLLGCLSHLIGRLISLFGLR
jgi:hypothetical protein